MKVVIAGATGFVGTELVRQTLRMPSITSVIALARHQINLPSTHAADADTKKLRCIVLESYDKFPNEAKAEFATADACIWTVAITPTKSSLYEWDDVRRVCYDSPLAGLQAMIDARSSSDAQENRSPLRFLYMSGARTERDQTKTPSFRPQYSLMRGETESAILSLATTYSDKAEACIVKPGFILAPNDYAKMAFSFVLKLVVSLPEIGLREISTAMIDQVVNGFEKDTLENDDLMRLGSVRS